jgi:hypothetical protein
VSVLADWQARFDADFPYGMLMYWAGSDMFNTVSPRYHVERIEVTHLQGFDPVVSLDVDGVEKGFIIIVTSYYVIQRDPVLATVTGTNILPMMWSALPQPQAR